MIFRRIQKFADDCRRFPKKSRRCFDHISYISQSPGSRVQSPESSPLVYASMIARAFNRVAGNIVHFKYC